VGRQQGVGAHIGDDAVHVPVPGRRRDHQHRHPVEGLVLRRAQQTADLPAASPRQIEIGDDEIRQGKPRQRSQSRRGPGVGSYLQPSSFEQAAQRVAPRGVAV